MLNTTYGGAQIKQFDLGLTPLADEDSQAYLVSLMATDSLSSPTTRSETANVDLAQPRKVSRFLSSHETTYSLIETLAPLDISTTPPSSADHAGSPPFVAVEATGRFFPTTAPQPTKAHALGQDNITATMLPVSPAAPQHTAGHLRAAAALSATMIAGLTPGPAFDAHDIYEGQIPCKAYMVLNQEGCGECYAFSSATAFSARLRRANPSASVSKVILSPQSLRVLDCTSGCNGCHKLSTLASLVSRPAVQQWSRCDHFTVAKQASGSACGKGNTNAALAGWVRWVGGLEHTGWSRWVWSWCGWGRG